MKALKEGFGVKPVGDRLRRLASASSARSRSCFGGAPALLLGIEDPLSNAHAPNESLHARRFPQADGVAGASLRADRQIAGWEGEVTCLFV